MEMFKLQLLLHYKVETDLIDQIYEELGVTPCIDTFYIIYKYDYNRTWSLSWIKTVDYMKVKTPLLKLEDKCLSDKIEKNFNKI